MQALAWSREFIRQEMALQKDHFFLWTPVALGLGIVLYFSLDFEPDLVWGAAATLASLSVLFFVHQQGALRRAVILLFCASLGFTLSIVRTASVYTPILEREIKMTEVTGTLERLEYLEGGRGFRGILRDVEIENVAPEKTPRKVRLKLRANDVLKVGERIKVLAGLNPPSPPVYPGGFDFQRYSFFQSLGAIGFSYKNAEIVAAHEGHGFWDRIEDLRFAIGERILQSLPESEGAVANALMTGPRAAISEADNIAIQNAGLAHMLSISGLHISLLFGAIFFMSRMIMAFFPAMALHHPIKKYAAVLAMAGALFYTLISGCSIPTLRSIFMMGIVFLAIMIDRKAFSMRLVAFAALVVLVFAPESLLSVSFQLSFAAVGALIIFHEDMQGWQAKLYKDAGWGRRVLLYLGGICLASVIATFATAPFTLYHFQKIAPYSVLGNVLAVPVLGFIVMPFAILALVLMPLGLDWLVFPVIGFGVDLILDISYWVSGLEGSAFTVRQWPHVTLLCFAVSFLIWLLIKGRLRFLFIVPLLVSLFFIVSARLPDVLVTDNSKMFALKLADGSLSFSDGRKERFTRENFLRAFGRDPEGEIVIWPKEGALADLRCDPHACRVERSGYNISFLRKVGAAQEECPWADIVIATTYVDECEAKIVIDRRDTKAQGAQVLFLDKDLQIDTAERYRKKRPWNARANDRSASGLQGDPES